MTSSRFATALHALALLAKNPEGASSDWIAGSVRSHAVALRRILNKLVAARLIEASEGRGGGYRLRRPAEEITLDQVWAAVEGDALLAANPAEPNPQCPIGSGMRATFSEVADRAQAGMLAALASQSVAQVAARAQVNGKRAPRRG